MMAVTLSTLGCERSNAVARGELVDFPPNLGGVVPPDGDDDNARTRVSVLDVLGFGDEISAELPEPETLAGYEFEAFLGAVPVIVVDGLDGGDEVGLALYGPRDDIGVWGEAVTWTATVEDGSLTIDGFEIQAAGMYFVLVQALNATSKGSFTLRLGCQGNCGAPSCVDLEPCDLVCPRGFSHDAEGCRVCACEGPSTCDAEEGCRPGERCDPAGRCVPDADPCSDCPPMSDPVCGADGVTYGNACRARCVDVDPVSRGPCARDDACGHNRQCPEEQSCRAGLCVIDACDCSPVVAPVCSATGRQYQNECLLRCVPEEEIAYRAPCLDDRCFDDDHCPSDAMCLPVPQRANIVRCERDIDAPECVRTCQRVRDPHCEAGDACGGQAVCYRAPSRTRGICRPLCDPSADLESPRGCGRGQNCAVVDGVPGTPPDAGICLAQCGPQGVCPTGSQCRPDRSGEPACLLCECDLEPEAPVCGVDNLTYRNPCEARCSGITRFRPGRCEGTASCICGAEWAPVCGLDGVLYINACEARCAEVPRANFWFCLDDTPPRTPCRRDAECEVTGAEGELCSAVPSSVDVSLSAGARCLAERGDCQCLGDTCGWAPTREVATCLPPP